MNMIPRSSHALPDWGRWRSLVFLTITALLVPMFLTATPVGAAVRNSAVPRSQELSVRHLKVNGDTNPLAVTGRPPVFSWQQAATRPNTLQSAYQILVATRPDRLVDVWDSG